MTLLALGLNHGSASLDTRGLFAISEDTLARSVQALRAHLARDASEAAILSTCNRTELYVATHEPASLRGQVLEWLAARAGWRAEQLDAHAYAVEGAAAARHAFRVASGLDSQVLGEPMILGQLKRAVRAAESAGALGSTLHQLFQRSFSVAKQVRTDTDIGAHSVSLAAATVRAAEQLFGDLAPTRVLCVGAGEMIERVAAHVGARRPAALVFANRTPARSEALAARFAAASMPLADVPGRLKEFDIVVSCTASTLPLIGLGAVERALKNRRRRPMLLVDLAVPRDIEPEVAELPDAYLRTIDDLADVVREGGAQRLAAVERAEALVDAGVRGFEAWLGQRDQVPLIRALQDQAAHWSADEIARARRRLARGESPDDVLAALARGLTAKMMHGPLAALHAGAADEELSRCVTQLFLQRQPACAANG